MPQPPRRCQRCNAEIASGPFMTIEATRVGAPRAESRRWVVCVSCGNGAWSWLACPKATLEALGLDRPEQPSTPTPVRPARSGRGENAATGRGATSPAAGR